MKAIDRLRVRRGYFSTYDLAPDKTDKTHSEGSEGGSGSFVSDHPVGKKIYGGSEPDGPCSVCGGGDFHQPPGDHWQCSTCTPPVLPPIHLQAGWSFCGIPDSQMPLTRALTKRTKPPLPMPPPPPGTVVYLDEVLPGLDARIGKCRCCPFTAPLTEDGRCGACVFAALVEEER